jgi:hypothetical protein
MRRWVMKSDLLDSSETGGPAGPLAAGVVFFLQPLSAVERGEAEWLSAVSY